MPLSFQELLKTYRKSMGWTQEDLSQKWDYSFETISAWERGKRKPSNQEIPRLAKLLEVSPEDLAESFSRERDKFSLPRNRVGRDDETRPDWKTDFAVWGELQRIYRTRTEFNSNFSYSRLFENAHSIIATGISLNAISLAYSRDLLLKYILEGNCTLRLCFLDPKGKHCAEREEEEDHPQGTLSDLTHVNIVLMQSLRKQIEKRNPERSKQLEIRIYDVIPRYNIYIIDDTFMTIQSYGYGRGEDTPTLVLKRLVKNGLFDFYASIAQHLLDHSIDISDNTTKEYERGHK